MGLEFLQIVPAVLVVLAGVWWMSGLNSRVKSLEERVRASEDNLAKVVTRFDEVHSALIRLEAKVDVALKSREVR